MKRLTARSDLTTLARDLGVGGDWHEPDEQEVTVEVSGTSFDNAGFWPAANAVHYPTENGECADITEIHVIISHEGKEVAAVNLATLFAWAAGTER